jgi:hypothetical protein
MAMKSFNPLQVSVIVGTKALTGWAKGTFINASMDEDAFTKKVGTDGEVTRSKSNNNTGSIIITLDQASASNDYLSGLALLDRASGGGAVPVLIRDANGTTLISAESAWVKKMPDVEISNESLDREWILDCGSLEYFVGGN